MEISPIQARLPIVDRIADTGTFFTKVRDAYSDYVAQGAYYPLAAPACYCYEITVGPRSYTGIIAGVATTDYLRGAIRRHENTLVEREQVHLQLIQDQGAMLKPILLACPELPTFARWVADHRQGPPIQEVYFPGEDQTHRIWAITEPVAIEQLVLLFRQRIPHCYLADGHHRCATNAALFEQSNGQNHQQLLAAFFPGSDLTIHSFNRVVDLKPEWSAAELLDALRPLGTISPLSIPQGPAITHEMTLIADKRWYRFRWHESILEQASGPGSVVLDTDLLNHHILRDILGVTDVRSDPRLQYLESPRGLDDWYHATVDKPNRVGFGLFPISLQDIMLIADQGRSLPPKSTWFEPRMKTGLVVLPFP